MSGSWSSRTSPSVGDAVVEQLQSLGYAVTQATDGSAGLTAFETVERPYDLLLTDIVMPGLNGKKLADEVTARWPGTSVLFMSGFRPDNIVMKVVSTPVPGS